jgi:hypothetical protein
MPNKPPATDDGWHRHHLMTALLISLAAIWLHSHFFAHAGGLWRDEVNLVNLANSSSAGDLARDSFPVLMPLIVRVWSAVGWGGTDGGLRLLGALIGCGLLAAFWFAARATTKSPPTWSLVLFGMNSMAIAYGDSLRAYGLGCMLVVLTAAAGWSLTVKSSPARVACFAMLAGLSVQALYQNAVLVGAICFGAGLVSARRKDWRAAAGIVAGGLTAAVSLLPYLPGLLSVPETTASLRVGFQPAIAATNLATATAFPLPDYTSLWGLLSLFTLVAGGVACGRPVAADGNAADPRLFAAATLLAAGAGFAGFLWLAALPTQPWYYLPCLALVATCFDAGLQPWPRRWRAVPFGLIVATALISIPFARRDLNCRFTNVDLLAHRLAAEAAPDDFVLVTPWYCGIGFERYFKSSTPWVTVPPLTDHSRHRYDLVQAQMRNPEALQPVFEQIASTLQAGRRVWVVGWLDVPAANAPLPANLSSPPLNYSGWADTPFALRWAAQTAQFLRNHSRRFVSVAVATNDSVHFNENLRLLTAEGWQTNSW